MSAETLPPISIISVIGLPGAGKGTLCKRLADSYDYTHLSVGDLVRNEAKTDPEMKALSDQNILLPTETIIGMLKREIHRLRMSGVRALLLDGFPRELSQFKSFETEVQPFHCMLYFECDFWKALDRVVERRDGRLGDTEEVFKLRSSEFNEKNPAILRHARARRTPIVTTDTSGETEVSWQKLMVEMTKIRAPDESETAK